MNELPLPYTDFLFIAPIERKMVIGTSLNMYARVLAVGPEVKNTTVGDIVAFELWDKPEFKLESGITCHFLREKDAVCKLPESMIA